MRPQTRSAALVLILALSGSVLSGCGLFTPAETLNMTPADSGMDARAGDYQIQNAIVIVDAAGTASLSATILNNSDVADNVNSVTINGTAAQLTPAEQTVAAGGALRFGFNSTSYADVPQSNIEVGSLAKVTITMASGQRIIVRALTYSSTDPLYSSITPAPVSK